MDGREVELESKILAAAFRQSVERGDENGIQLAHAELCKLLTINDEVQVDGIYEPAPIREEARPIAEVYTRIDFEEETLSGSSEYPSLAGRALPDLESTNYYERIAAEPSDTPYLIQRCYMRAVRLLLRKNFVDGKLQAVNIYDFRRQLRNMGIAYHLLNDPSSRSDYDLRLAGIRTPASGLGLYVPDEAKAAISGGRARLSFAELLALSGLSGEEEFVLLPEEEFFARMAALLKPAELESLRVGYELISKGLISILQYQKALLITRQSGQRLIDTLVNMGWLGEEAFSSRQNNFSAGEFVAPKIVEVRINLAPQPVPLPKLNMSGAVPSWASDMDWEAETGEILSAGAIEEPAETVPQRRGNKKPDKNGRKPSRRRKKDK